MSLSPTLGGPAWHVCVSLSSWHSLECSEGGGDAGLPLEILQAALGSVIYDVGNEGYWGPGGTM